MFVLANDIFGDRWLRWSLCRGEPCAANDRGLETDVDDSRIYTSSEMFSPYVFSVFVDFK